MLTAAIARPQRGALMIEVLVTIAIVVIGLWGLMEVQARLQQSEMESYQRTQALLLLNDMSNRLSVNRGVADEYLTTDLTPAYLGHDMTCPTSSTSVAEADMAQWCDSLQGAAEVVGTANVGGMVGARGCVDLIGTSDDEYMVTVVWQGLSPLSPPPAEVTCGAGLYDLPADSPCADQADACRRYVTTIVHVGNLLDPT